MAEARVIVLMGVSGVGKTTVGRRLADALDCPFYDGDAFHPEANVRKMRAGLPLDDEDRQAWLLRLRELILSRIEKGERAVLACSALKESYRDVLRVNGDGVRFVYLKAPRAVVEKRIEHRSGHFFPPELLASQFETLEEPADALVVDAARSTDAIVRDILEKLGEA